jgi:hypothetical protein
MLVPIVSRKASVDSRFRRLIGAWRWWRITTDWASETTQFRSRDNPLFTDN